MFGLQEGVSECWKEKIGLQQIFGVAQNSSNWQNCQVHLKIRLTDSMDQGSEK